MTGDGERRRLMMQCLKEEYVTGDGERRRWMMDKGGMNDERWGKERRDDELKRNG